MSMDDLDRWLAESPDQGPLFEAAAARVSSVPVDERAVDAIATRVQRRMRRETPRRRGWALLPLAAATVAIGVWASWPQEPELVATWDVPSPPAQVERVRPDPSVADPGAEAAAWLAAGHAWDAVLRYQLLLAERPMDPQAASWQTGLVEALHAQGDTAAAVTAALDLVERYGPGTPWGARHGTPEGEATMSRALRKAAVLAHAAGREAKDDALLDRAGVAYERFLSHRSEPEEEIEIRYAYGELLYRRGRFDEAWEQYRQVSSDPQNPRAQFCAESAVFAAEEMMKASAEPEIWRERFVATLDDYVDKWPEDRKSVDMRYKAAYAIYQVDPRGSVERFTELALAAPDTREGGYAANLALNAFVVDEDFSGAVALAEQLLDEADLPDSVRAEVAEAGAKAAYQTAAEAVRAGADPAETWGAYLEAWPDGPAPQ